MLHYPDGRSDLVPLERQPVPRLGKPRGNHVPGRDEHFIRPVLARTDFCGFQLKHGIPALLLLLTWLHYYLQCKHILAVYLSQAMGACQELSVSEEQLTSILLAEEEDEG